MAAKKKKPAAKKQVDNKPEKDKSKVGIAGENPPNKKKPIKGKKIAIAGEKPPKRNKRIS